MRNKKFKTFFSIAVSTMFITSMTNFSCHTVEESGKDGWDYDTIVVNNTCSMYIEYAKGKHLLNISTMDSCVKLNDSMYLEGYKQLLDRYSHKLLSDKGIVTFQTSFVLLNNIGFTNKLIDITNEKFKANSTIIKKEKSVFIIDVKPK